MYIRVTRVRTQPGKVDELTERWRARFVPSLQQVSGFRRAYYGGDRYLNSVVVVTFWDDLPRATHLGPMVESFEDGATDLLAAPAVIEEFEVLAEAEPRP